VTKEETLQTFRDEFNKRLAEMVNSSVKNAFRPDGSEVTDNDLMKVAGDALQSASWRVRLRMHPYE
jgi:molybdopterin-biosynthesis enzyme MoeA-like protein